jgi:hypothetical protein
MSLRLRRNCKSGKAKMPIGPPQRTPWEKLMRDSASTLRLPLQEYDTFEFTPPQRENLRRIEFQPSESTILAFRIGNPRACKRIATLGHPNSKWRIDYAVWLFVSKRREDSIESINVIQTSLISLS